jgi:Tfp pilus assembly protein PilO
MKLPFRQRDRRALLILLGAGALYLICTQFVFPRIDRLREASAVASEREEQLRKYRQVVQRKGHYTELLEQAKKSMTDAESRLIRGDNPSTASIDLQAVVEEAAKKVDINFAQKNVLPAKKKDQFFNEITMSVSFDASPNQLTTFIANLRSTPKLITVRNLQLTPVETPNAPPKKGEFRKILRVNMTVGAVLTTQEKNG